jgi:hypothetical protein
MSQQVLLASTPRTASPTAVEFSKGRAERLMMVVNVTAITATPQITVRIDFWDDASGTWSTLLTSVAITTVVKTILRVGPGNTNTANVAVNEALPDRLRVDITHLDADSITYSVGVHLID